MLTHKTKANVMKYTQRLNELLQKYTDIKIIELTANYAKLSNGLELTTESDVRKLKQRISKTSIEYMKLFDSIYSIDASIAYNAEKEAKRLTSRKGGISVQKKHGDKIKKNLNNGIPWNKELGGNYPHAPWSKGKTKETHPSLYKLSHDRLGEGNPMYGIQLSDEAKQLKSEIMKEKILNGDFTPNSNNRNTHWESTYRGKTYRSSWEALCQHIYPDAEYETLRVKYEYNNNSYIYIVDFVDHNSKKAIEVKPKEFQTGKKYVSKMEALSKWCNKNGYELIIFDQADIIQIELTEDQYELFDKNTIRKLHTVRK